MYIANYRGMCMDSLSLGIIDLLKHGGNYTSLQIAKVLSVSDRTIRNRIKETNEQMSHHGALIQSVRGQGYCLEIFDSEVFSKWLKEQYEEKDFVPNSSEERVRYLADYLLYQKNYVYIDDLCDLLYVSRNTLSSDLKKVEQVIYKYNLSIERRPNYGIKIDGSEMNKRFCIIDGITHNKQYFIDKIKKESIIMTISDTLSKEFHANKFHIPVNNYQILKLIFYITYLRVTQGFSIQFQEEELKKMLLSIPEKIVNMVDRIIIDLGTDYKILNQDDEKLYLAMQIAGRGSFENDREGYKEEGIDELVNHMLLEVKEGLKIDLTSDFDLIMALRHHLVALDIRMKYHIPVENPILETIKRRYSLAYGLASYSCNYLSEYYNQAISNDEVGYLAIIYELALEKKSKPIKKKNVVIVCATGTSMSKFFVQKYREIFGEYLDEVYECSAKDIMGFDFEGKCIDYCFTTLDCDFFLPIPCYKISLFPSEKEIKDFKKIFAKDNQDELLKFYREDFFIPNLSADNKEEAIKKMIDHISARTALPENFCELVLQREKYGLTSFGNLAATPHPCRTCTEENIVGVAILEKPIDWGSNDVQVIILLSLSMNESLDSKLFIEATTNFISDDDAIERLIQNRSFDYFLNLLMSENEH